jgi:nucleoside 2-deoxyribosyltransferase
MKHYVYLAGPITGLTYDGAQDWRTFAALQLDSDKIETLSPLRGKNYLLKRGVLHAGEYKEAMSTSKGINRRDHFDCVRADCVFVNLLDTPDKVSIGTMMEIAWAWDHQIPVIAVMENDNIHDHAMVNDCITYRVTTLEEGYELVRFLFNEVPNERD